MGHHVSTLSERSSGRGGGNLRQQKQQHHPIDSMTASRNAFLLAMLLTVSAAASSSSSYPAPSSSSLASPPSGRGWSPAGGRGARRGRSLSCCFVAAAEPRGHSLSSGAGAGAGGGRYRFRRRTQQSSCGATSAATADVGWRQRQSRPQRRPGAPTADLSRRRRPNSRDEAAGTTSLPPVGRTVGNMPPHLAAAFGASAVTDNGDLILDDEEYERRKLEWAQRYTDVTTLRTTFGTNRNQLWGDLDPEATRRLYHTLLPRALMGLYDMGLMRPHELAPLAYEARVAAKKYARERCIVPGRVFSMAYDGFRSLRDYGRWNPEGLSWDQIWDKYEAQIVDEFDFEDHEEDELTKQICLRILERSCRTNTAVDQLLLGSDAADRIKKKENEEMAAISAKLERDVHDLLFEGAQKSVAFSPTREQKKKLKERKREIKREEMRRRTELRATERAFMRALRNEEERRTGQANESITSGEISDDSHSARGGRAEKRRVRLTPQEVWFLRTIAGTKKKILNLRPPTPLIKKLHGSTTADPPDDGGVATTSGHRKKTEDDLVEASSPIVEVSPNRRPKLWLNRGSILPRRKSIVHPTDEEEVLTP